MYLFLLNVSQLKLDYVSTSLSYIAYSIHRDKDVHGVLLYAFSAVLFKCISCQPLPSVCF